MLHSDLTGVILKLFFRVYYKLGYGFLEKEYENALRIELNEAGLSVKSQSPIKVHYKRNIIGDYYADIVVENKVIIELKAAEQLCKEHELQLINYLRATEFEVGMLLNFGKRPEFRRKIFTNDRKKLNDR